MFVLRSMRKHPEIFGGRSVNHSRTERKAIDNTQGRASRLSSSGVPFAGLQPVPAAATGLRSSPRSKRMTRPCASRTLLSSCLRGNAGSRCGNLDARAEPTWPRQAFSSIAAMYPVLASATAPLAVRSRLGPT